MVERIGIGLVSSLAVIAWLARRRHVQLPNLLWMGFGWAVFFIVLAVAFEAPARDPILFLLGCVAGASIQHGFDAEKRRDRTTVKPEQRHGDPEHAAM